MTEGQVAARRDVKVADLVTDRALPCGEPRVQSLPVPCIRDQRWSERELNAPWRSVGQHAVGILGADGLRPVFDDGADLGLFGRGLFLHRPGLSVGRMNWAICCQLCWMWLGSIQNTSQIWPSRSLELRPYMKPKSMGSRACMAAGPSSSTFALASVDRAVSTSVDFDASTISFLVNSLNLACVSSIA